MSVQGPPSHRYMAFVMLVLAGAWGHAMVRFVQMKAPGSLAFGCLLASLLFLGAGIAALLPIRTEVLPGSLLRRSFGLRRRQLSASEVDFPYAVGDELYLVLTSGERLLIARGLANAEHTGERLMDTLHAPEIILDESPSDQT